MNLTYKEVELSSSTSGWCIFLFEDGDAIIFHLLPLKKLVKNYDSTYFTGKNYSN